MSVLWSASNIVDSGSSQLTSKRFVQPTADAVYYLIDLGYPIELPSPGNDIINGGGTFLVKLSNNGALQNYSLDVSGYTCYSFHVTQPYIYIGLNTDAGDPYIYIFNTSDLSYIGRSSVIATGGYTCVYQDITSVSGNLYALLTINGTVSIGSDTLTSTGTYILKFDLFGNYISNTFINSSTAAILYSQITGIYISNSGIFTVTNTVPNSYLNLYDYNLSLLQSHTFTNFIIDTASVIGDTIYVFGNNIPFSIKQLSLISYTMTPTTQNLNFTIPITQTIVTPAQITATAASAQYGIFFWLYSQSAASITYTITDVSGSQQTLTSTLNTNVSPPYYFSALFNVTTQGIFQNFYNTTTPYITFIDGYLMNATLRDNYLFMMGQSVRDGTSGKPIIFSGVNPPYSITDISGQSFIYKQYTTFITKLQLDKYIPAVVYPSPIPRTYWPTQTDRITRRLAYPCPCNVTTESVASSGALTLQRKFAISCCPYYIVSDASSDGFTIGSYYVLQGGTPKGKPTLYQAVSTTALVVVFAGEYYIPPSDIPITVIAADGSGSPIAITPDIMEICPCPSYN